MARLSKSHHFKIFEDTGIPTPPHEEEDDPFRQTRPPIVSTTPSTPSTPCRLSRHQTAAAPSLEHDSDDEEEALPRESLTSISTYPESSSQHDERDYAPPVASPQKYLTPQIIRPSFRRPESVRRMQMSSPRQSILSHHRGSRSGTPRSEIGRGSPRARRRITEEWTSDEDGEAKSKDKQAVHPLVLLHIILLPIVLPWSTESMQEVLPAQVLEDLQLLRSKVSHTMLHRGILIPHPREDYELLEERLLEALELKQERLTKCGHFRGRMSDASTQSRGAESDSGLGSSASGSEDDGEVCGTCRHHIRSKPSKKRKWSVGVFAANGLMRAAAWAAAWEGMESVDVEILPWVSEEHSKVLDRRREDEEKERELELEAERREGLMLLTQVGGDFVLEAERNGREATDNTGHEGKPAPTACIRSDTMPPRTIADEDKKVHDLPLIYRASQVPLFTLLRNYVYLLAQDRRNVAMLFMAILAAFFALRSAPSNARTGQTAMLGRSDTGLPAFANETHVADVLAQPRDGVGARDSAREAVPDAALDDVLEAVLPLTEDATVVVEQKEGEMAEIGVPDRANAGGIGQVEVTEDAENEGGP